MLSLTNVRKSFGNIVAVNGLSLSVRKGEVFGLLGPNGAGKSTAVNLAVGLLAPESGEVRIDGVGNPVRPEVRQMLGVATQAVALYDLLSGEENLRFFGEMYGLSGATLSSRVAWCLDFVGLTDRKDDRVAGYSGGMKRRLNLAAAVVHDPAILLLDEPTVGVDPQSRNKIFDNIEALRRDGRTVIYTTHYMEEAERLCDRIAIIDSGKLLAIGTLAELLAQYGGPPTLVIRTARLPTAVGRQPSAIGHQPSAVSHQPSAIGHQPTDERRIHTPDPLAELNRIAAETRIESFQLEQPTLEQVFLRLTGRSLRD